MVSSILIQEAGFPTGREQNSLTLGTAIPVLGNNVLDVWYTVYETVTLVR